MKRLITAIAIIAFLLSLVFIVKSAKPRHRFQVINVIPRVCKEWTYTQTNRYDAEGNVTAYIFTPSCTAY